jgi:hypothetical protein
MAVLMGGPCAESIGAAEIYVRQFVLRRQARDILLVDQRGTGHCGALQCDLILTGPPTANLVDLFPLAAVEECERRLRVQAYLTQYTYDCLANDLKQQTFKKQKHGPTRSRVRITEFIRGLIRNSSRAGIPADVPEKRADCVYGQCRSNRRGDTACFCEDGTNGAQEDVRHLRRRFRM